MIFMPKSHDYVMCYGVWLNLHLKLFSVLASIPKHNDRDHVYSCQDVCQFGGQPNIQPLVEILYDTKNKLKFDLLIWYETV